jgi:hypothetical protein
VGYEELKLCCGGSKDVFRKRVDEDLSRVSTCLAGNFSGEQITPRARFAIGGTGGCVVARVVVLWVPADKSLTLPSSVVSNYWWPSRWSFRDETAPL